MVTGDRPGVGGARMGETLECWPMPSLLPSATDATSNGVFSVVVVPLADMADPGPGVYGLVDGGRDWL